MADSDFSGLRAAVDRELAPLRRAFESKEPPMSTEADIVERLTDVGFKVPADMPAKDKLLALINGMERLCHEAGREITKLRAERAAAVRCGDLLMTAVRSAHTQCGNVIFNCEQRPTDNAKHLASWKGVHMHLEDAIAKGAAMVATSGKDAT